MFCGVGGEVQFCVGGGVSVRGGVGARWKHKRELGFIWANWS